MKMGWFAVLLVIASGCATPRYLARVNGDDIGGDEALRVFGRQHVALEKALVDEGDIRRLLDKVVDRRLFVQEAHRLGLASSPDVVETVIRYEGDLLVALMRQREIDEKAAVREEDVTGAHAMLDRALVVRQLVASSRTEAEALRQRVAAGEDLEKLVREASIAASSRRGGTLMMQWGGQDVARETMAFELGEGELSAVFRSSEGWEFIRLERRVDRKVPDLEQTRAELERVLHRRALQQRESEIREELWSKYEAKLEPCAPTADGGQAPAVAPLLCATWAGGALAQADVAKEVDRRALSQYPPEVAADLLERSVRDLAGRELMVVEARARGWAALPEIADKVGFKRENLIEEKLYAEYVFRDVSATDDEVRAYFESKPEEFVRPEKFELAHIAVADAAAIADVAKALAAGAVFEDLAAERSLDKGSAARGGYVGSFTQEQLKAPLDQVLALEVGGVTDPIQLGENHHLVKLVRKHAERRLSFEEAAEQAKEQLVREKAMKRYEKWAETLRRSSKIKVNARAVRAFSAERLAVVRKAAEEQQEKARQAEEQQKKANEAAAGTPAQPAEPTKEPVAAPDQPPTAEPVRASAPAR